MISIPEEIRSIQNKHTRDEVSFIQVIQDLEEELKRMKEKNLPQKLIDIKDSQIEALIDYNNSTDTILKYYKTLVMNLHLELKISDSLLMSTASNREHLIDALINFKIRKFDDQTTATK